MMTYYLNIPIKKINEYFKKYVATGIVEIKNRRYVYPEYIPDEFKVFLANENKKKENIEKMFNNPHNVDKNNEISKFDVKKLIEEINSDDFDLNLY